MPTLSNILCLTVVACAMVLFILEKLRVDLVALCVLVLLIILRLIRPEQALYGFANPATATVACMFVISAGLARTGFVDWIGRFIDKIAGKAETQLILVLCITIAILSAFIVNTATVAIFIPVTIALAKTRRIQASRVLIPLSYASQFGGVCTLIGTSTNILVNSIATSNGIPGFNLFEFAKLGLVMSGVGIVYLILVAKWLLPKRKGKQEQIDKYRLSDYFVELKVKEDSPLIGKTWKKNKSDDIKDIELIKLIRGKKATWSAKDTKIKEDDILLLHGEADKLIKMKDNYKLESKGDVIIDDKKISSDEIKLIEALIPPQSRLVGRTLRSSDFIRRFGCVALAIQRRGKTLRKRLADIHLDGGDTLLLQCRTDAVNRIMRSEALIVTNELTEFHLRKNRAAIALCIVILVVVLAALNIVPILVAALIGAVGMVLGRTITIEEAYQAIDWKVIFLLGGILPLGLALQQSGTATWLVNTAFKPIGTMSPIFILAALYIITALLTEAMSNNAAAILLAPIALSFAVVLNVNPRPFLIAITFAASTSFATPIGYQTNTMIYTPGGYRFHDFIKVGLPLNLLFWITAVLLIPKFWNF